MEGVALPQQSMERPTVDSVLRKWSLIDRINLDLVRANLHLQVGEYLLLRLGLSGALAFLIFFISKAWRRYGGNCLPRPQKSSARWCGKSVWGSIPPLPLTT